MSNQSLFGWPAGALMKVRRSTVNYGTGSTYSTRPTVELQFDTDRRTNNESLESQGRGSPVLPVTDFIIDIPVTWNTEGSFDTGALIIGPSPSKYSNRKGAGNRRGLNSIEISAGKTASSQVSSGDRSLTVGYGTTASGLYSTALGAGASASGSYSAALGNSASSSGAYSFSVGRNSSSSGSYSVAVGYSTLADGTSSFAGGDDSRTNGIMRHSRATGDRQVQVYEHLLKKLTTNATPTTITTDGSAASSTNQNILANNSCQTFWGMVEAYSYSAGAMASWIIQGKIRRGSTASTTVLVDSTVTAVGTPDSALSTTSIALAADTTNGGLSVNVTGVASTSVYWGCSMYSSLRATS